MIEGHMLYRRETRNHTEWMGEHDPKRRSFTSERVLV